MKKRLLAVLICVTMVLSMLVACGNKGEAPTAGDETKESNQSENDATNDSDNDDDPDAGDSANGEYHFEIVSKGFQSTYWQAVYKGASVKAIELGVTINMIGPNSESDIADQVQMLNNAINAEPDAIGLASLDTNAALDSITTAQDMKLPIIGFDSGVPDAPEGAVYANASTDNYNAGTVAADGMYEGIKDRITNATGQVRIGEVNQDATSESIYNRGLGFIDQMISLITADGKTVAVIGNDFYVSNSKGDVVDENDADVVIEVRVPAQTTTELTAIEASTILNQDDTIAVFGSNQVAAEGIITANENLNVLGTGEDQIIGVGFDSGSVVKSAIQNETLYGAVTQAPVAIGEKLVELLLSVAKGESVSDVDTGCQWYNADNIDTEEIAQNLYD